MPERVLPWSETCFVCGDHNPRGLGVRFVEDGGRVRLNTNLDPSFEGYPGHTHGGVITALLDEASGWAACVAARRLCFTVEITVRFRRPVPGGVPITVWGETLEPSGRFHRARAWIEDEHGRELARSEGLFKEVTEEVQADVVSRLRMPGRPADARDL